MIVLIICCNVVVAAAAAVAATIECGNLKRVTVLKTIIRFLLFFDHFKLSRSKIVAKTKAKHGWELASQCYKQMLG